MTSNTLFFGEVTKILYNDDDIEYQTFIECKLLDDNSFITARAINKQIKYIPVKGEIVVLLFAPSAYYSNNEKQFEYYYLFSINLHENVNHNSLFNATTIYTNVYDNKSLDSKFGDDFDETYCNDLQAYEGDTIIQGRFGNSIRLSKSNIKNNLNHPSFWIDDKKKYNPVIILSNNRKTTDVNKNKQITEDINKDGSSLYITYGQKINLDSSSGLYDSFNKKPKNISDFSDNQMLLNSDRIILNAKTDSILVHAKRAVHLSSNDTVNIDSKNETVINSAKTFVGNKDATEPFLFGDKTDDWLNELLDILNDINNGLIQHIHGTGVGPSAPPLAPALNTFTQQTPKIGTTRQKIKDLKSKVNFVT